MRLSRVFKAATPNVFALRTTDGGALVFSGADVTDSLVGSPGHPASLREGSNDAALLGKPGGAKAQRFTIDRQQMFVTYVPTRASGAKARVIAYSETAVSVK